MTPRVLILGGGFAGLTFARRLEQLLPPQAARVTLVSDGNAMLYTPLLPGAAGGTLEPRHVVVPLREQLVRTEFRLGTVTGADPERRVVRLETVDGAPQLLEYDHLVVAVGSVSRTLPVPGLAEHGRGFKSLPDAIALRNHVLRTLERAEGCGDEAIRRELLTYVFVGAGYAGLEGLAELQDLAADVIELYPVCRLAGMRWMLVEARERVMGEISEPLARYAEQELRSRGIELRLGTRVQRISERSVLLSDGEEVPARTLVWTAGVKPHPVVRELGLPLAADGRIVAGRDLQVQGRPEVWALGDAAGVPDPADLSRPCPPTAQHAIRQARVAAVNVEAALRGSGRRKQFNYKTLGVFVDMGRHEAVASTLGIRWRGFPAWFLARTYHLLAMPGSGRRARLVADWTVGLLFGRDSAELGRLGHPSALEAPSAAGEPAGAGAPAD